jgi:hypothetical protein
MKKIKKRIRLLKVFTFILILILAVILIIQFKLYEPVLRIINKPRLYVIPDECSLIMNNLIHQIKNEDDCRIRCVNLCNGEDKRITSSTLLTPVNSCYECNCYCK